jgi:DNA-binding Lrp family transcriptional regulator
VSVEAISWALNLAPVPADRGGQPSSACKFVLVGLANHAGPDGTGAFPSAATLVRYTGLSERTVRTCLDRLQAEGIISRCDPDIVAARIKRADRRPQGWDLNLSRVRADLDDADTAVLESQFPGLGFRLAAAVQPPGHRQSNEVQSMHPAASNCKAVDNRPSGVQPLHPEPGTGCSQRADGVQLTQERGAAIAPEPYKEPSQEPPVAPAHAREALQVAEVPGGGVSEFFDTLGPRWPLTGRQRASLTPAVSAALAAGWVPGPLAEFTGASTRGVRNPFAVLAARLSPVELPPPPRQRAARPPWCGECDQGTRMLGFDGDSPRPCPRCKPGAARRPARATTSLGPSRDGRPSRVATMADTVAGTPGLAPERGRAGTVALSDHAGRS